VSSGTITDKTIREYIGEQEGSRLATAVDFQSTTAEPLSFRPRLFSQEAG
jgi:hypothetical protein